MVAVAYRRWSFTRGSYGKALKGKVVVFRIGGRIWEMVALEVRLYHYHYFLISYAISDF